jgi:hypothetical protein
MFGRCSLSASRTDDLVTHPDDIHNSDNSRILFELGKDFSEDRRDARSSRPYAHLIRIRYVLFLKDIAETCPDGANFMSGRSTDRVRFSSVFKVS